MRSSSERIAAYIERNTQHLGELMVAIRLFDHGKPARSEISAFISRVSRSKQNRQSTIELPRLRSQGNPTYPSGHEDITEHEVNRFSRKSASCPLVAVTTR